MSDEKTKQLFSRKLNFYMGFNGVKQSDIVRDLKINSSTVSNWCNGVMIPRMDKMQLLADYLGITKADLIEEQSDNVVEEQVFLKSLNAIAPHFEYFDFTDDELEEIGNFIEYVKAKRTMLSTIEADRQEFLKNGGIVKLEEQNPSKKE